MTPRSLRKMAINGKIQREGDVVHLVAQQLFDDSRGPLTAIVHGEAVVSEKIPRETALTAVATEYRKVRKSSRQGPQALAAPSLLARPRVFQRLERRYHHLRRRQQTASKNSHRTSSFHRSSGPRRSISTTKAIKAPTISRRRSWTAKKQGCAPMKSGKQEADRKAPTSVTGWKRRRKRNLTVKTCHRLSHLKAIIK